MPPAIPREMDEQRDITSVVDRLEKHLRHEIIYVRGFAAMHRERYIEYLRDAAMHRERYIEYLRDLRKARWSKEYNRAEWIIEDLRRFAAEATLLQRKGSVAYRRLAGLAAERGFVAPDETPALPPDPRFARAGGDGAETPPGESTPPGSS